MYDDEISDVLERAAASIEVPTHDRLGAVVAAGQARRRRRRRSTGLAAAILAVGVTVGGLVATARPDHGQRVQTLPPATAGGDWVIDQAALAALHSYATATPEMSSVAHVVLKATTWANYVAWSRTTLGNLMTTSAGTGTVPPFKWNTRVYVVVQVGSFYCNEVYDCQKHTYHWSLRVVRTDDPAVAALDMSDAGSAFPPDFAAIPGPQADLDTATGAVRTTMAPPPPVPLLAVQSVIGTPLGDAAGALQIDGFTTAPVPAGDDMNVVRSQDPAPGILALAGSFVALTSS